MLKLKSSGSGLLDAATGGFQRLEADLTDLRTSLRRSIRARWVASVAENSRVLERLTTSALVVCQFSLGR